jgi:hypothetical protein
MGFYQPQNFANFVGAKTPIVIQSDRMKPDFGSTLVPFNMDVRGFLKIA